jgi:hypothetical protein
MEQQVEQKGRLIFLGNNYKIQKIQKRRIMCPFFKIKNTCIGKYGK